MRDDTRMTLSKKTKRRGVPDGGGRGGGGGDFVSWGRVMRIYEAVSKWSRDAERGKGRGRDTVKGGEYDMMTGHVDACMRMEGDGRGGKRRDVL